MNEKLIEVWFQYETNYPSLKVETALYGLNPSKEETASLVEFWRECAEAASEFLVAFEQEHAEYYLFYCPTCEEEHNEMCFGSAEAYELRHAAIFRKEMAREILAGVVEFASVMY